MPEGDIFPYIHLTDKEVPMALISPEEFLDRLRSYPRNVYVGGRLVDRDDPILMGGVNCVQETYRAALEPELRDLVVTRSHLTGQQISRFTNVHTSVEDLLVKQEMTRKLCHRVGGCIQRCMATDTLNAIGVVTKEMDDALGTEYHERFLNYLQYYQDNDLVGNAAQTDAKGDRSKRPAQQKDPDLYLRVVRRTKDGIVVRGAKLHNTMGPYSDEILVVPTRAMREDEGAYAVSFAIPAHTKGVKLICRVTNARERRALRAPFNRVGMVDSFTVFDDVFVPWERVFMCGEWEFAGRQALLFANFHRHSYCGCKPAVTDVILGATALVAEYNGIPNAPHIQDELSKLMIIAELVYASGIAAAVRGKRTSSGIYEPDALYSNTGRYLAGENIYHEYEILTAVAGGLPATLPFEQDWLNPETGPYLEKYIMRNPSVSAEKQHRLFRFISDFSCSAMGGLFQYAGVHGGGSPIMEKIGIRRSYDLESKKEIVKYLAGIED
jgi:4-hydroxyphenylacetate 3-monooxygenase/4-hydroxybutyryl-CoA dehydratase/vinylacetyl-CoA-Delta-isomerase